jgi:hypothetical protein
VEKRVGSGWGDRRRNINPRKKAAAAKRRNRILNSPANVDPINRNRSPHPISIKKVPSLGKS